LNTLLDGCDKCGCYGEAMDIFTIFKNKNIPCNMMTYSILLKILGKLNDFDNSFKLLNEMKDNDIKLNLIISTCFIKTCFNTNHIAEGLNLFKELPQYKIYPDNIAYTTIISGIIHNIQTGDYSDELISIVKKSIEDKIHLNKKIYFKSLYYLNLLDHKDKVESLTEYLKEKNIISLYQDNAMYSSNSKIEEISEKKDNKSSSPISNCSKSESNESTNNKTMNSTLTFNTPGYGFLNTINALNRCYYQKYCTNKNVEEKSSNKETSVSYTGDESCNSYKKETSLKEIFDNNLSYPFVYKNKNMSIFDFAKTDYKENSEKENKTDLSEEKGNSC
jgi:pentatricopeptide repeat protein